MKKLTTLLIAAIMILTMTACGGVEMTDLNTTIYSDDHISIVLHNIETEQLVVSVENKTDVDLTLMISDLYLDGQRYHESESCDEIYAGETNDGGTFYYLSEANLNTEATTISGKILYVDDGDLYGGEQKEIEFPEVTIER